MKFHRFCGDLRGNGSTLDLSDIFDKIYAFTLPCCRLLEYTISTKAAKVCFLYPAVDWGKNPPSPSSKTASLGVGVFGSPN